MVNYAQFYHEEVSALFVERLKDNGFGYLSRNPLTSSFVQALKNFHLLNSLTQEEQEEIEWGIRHAVIDASETVLIKHLVEIRYMREGEEEKNERFLNSLSYCSIDIEESENRVSLELRSLTNFNISLSVSTFLNLKNLENDLKEV
ncbi:hypothetical protein [Heyndrickxia camelliae]|uniref:Uncharacterized protein n=1 Tax=Heyndrickxia camelliae TaxID=1707093 RepID=A0A2N3LEP6_9BACI|nr:hypothetical protein [Heyndrickxia camelliae]PKR83023.1 hypothetical protein CWO92_21015 [Heyndrickxia camelliae]